MNSKDKTCKTCVYFYQHYGIDERHIWDINCGHCKFNKDVFPTKKICVHYEKSNKCFKPYKKKIIQKTLNDVYDKLEQLNIYLNSK